MKSLLSKKSLIVIIAALAVMLAVGSKSFAATEHLVFGGGATGGVFYIVASGMATLAQKYIPGVKASAEISAGSQENARRLAKGEQHFAMLSAEIGYQAYRKLREFKDSKDPLEDLRLVIYGYSSVTQIMVHEDSPIRSIADFKGKKIGVLIGPVAKSWVPIILDVYGLTVNDINAQNLGPAELMNALRDRQVEGVIYWGAAPTVAITDLCTTKNIRFLEFPDDKANIIAKDHPYFHKGVLPANTYRGQSADVKGLLTAITLSTTRHVKDDIVYNLTRAILTHNEELKHVHPNAALFNEKNAVGPAVIPYHPGAVKYYKEKGMMK